MRFFLELFITGEVHFEATEVIDRGQAKPEVSEV